MPLSPNLSLPLIEAGQAQKHVTVNEALRIVDASVHLRALDRAASPPAEPEPGASYLVDETPSGDFAGHANGVAVYEDNAWRFLSPRSGWRLWIDAEARLFVFDGEGWVDFVALALSGLDRLGINTASAGDNRLALRSNAALMHAIEAADGGTGDARLQLSKETEADTASVVFSENFSGQAEFGLNASSDFSLKVNSGSEWKNALVADRATGSVRFPQGIAHAASGLPTALYIPSPVREIWQLDASRGSTPRSFAIASVSGAAVTLTTAGVPHIFGNGMRNCVAVRVWNVSKSPAEAAWVNWNNSTTQVSVTDAAHVASWTAGETLRLGDPNPTGANVLEMVALDIGSYLFNELGAAFSQKAVMLGIAVSSSNGPSIISLSPNGASGSAFGGNALSNGKFNSMSAPIATPTPSPISGSNLVFLRESVAGGSTDLIFSYVRLLGVFA